MLVIHNLSKTSHLLLLREVGQEAQDNTINGLREKFFFLKQMADGTDYFYETKHETLLTQGMWS